MLKLIGVFAAWSLILLPQAMGLDVLKPVKTDSPKETMKTFMAAMNEYHEGVKKRDENREKSLDRAVRTLSLGHISPLMRADAGRKAAIYLKEVIDRVIVIDYEKIPPGKLAPEMNGNFWRLKNTEIVIRMENSGAREGEFLFSADTVDRAKDFYLLVKDYPYLEGTGQGAGFRETAVERYIPKALKGEMFGVPSWQLIGIFVSLILGFLVKIIAEGALSLGKRLATSSHSDWDDKMLHAVEGPAGYCAASGFWFMSLYILRLEGALLHGLSLFVQFVFSVSVIWIFYRLADVWSEYVAVVAKKTDLIFDDQLVPLLNRALRAFILIFGGLIAIQNLGVNVMSVIAGLGLGGLAFALAAKDTAANLFGSLMILWDRPFRIGDWIIFGGVEGTVEDVGFRSTRVRTFYNSLVTIPNAVVANGHIDNMGQRKFRRVKAVLGITYDTPPEKIEAFLEGIKNIIRANPTTKKDNFHVVFNNYGSSSLDILLYFFLSVPDWATELVQRQNIFIEVKRLAADLNIDFAFPTQSLHVESFPEKNGLDRHKDSWNDESLALVAKEFSEGGARAKPSGLGLFRPPSESP
ncbi:mechanosensitive ion channel family protein [Pseudobacteriovorax antillogorgiicola]|uniref:MscS family membrane protein n=1 Tax=Pseudobacteriovorax antillogorgiicola TaxID=1513793 RepID=A0A1Y6BY86_9BACT|nr:mechanosensitive ion channel family protein [Pseudobacteriovorax antillogorgiicola]TCS50318.1 MscS family membrane protein [Pseudobacteriovorax antillogorgiicola]SMF34161.1 MscS family membrane protein [Pseudobacteriovorax antillogorgiicola]